MEPDGIRRSAVKDVDNTLDTREQEYGSYETLSELLEMIVDAYKCSNNYWRLAPYQRVSLYMDAMKTARILNGDYNKIDSWHDKAGYAELVVKQLKKEIEDDK
jgi:hypothetical protein